MTTEYKLEMISPIGIPKPYYIVRGQIVTEKDFEEASFGELMMGDRSVVHVCEMTPAEIIERFGNTLTPEQIESLKNYCNV
jgi:hypothetical protein